MRRRPPTLIPLLALAALAVAPAGSHAATARKAVSCPHAHVLPERGGLEEARQATLCLLNRERTTRGLRPLRGHDDLEQAAQAHTRDMVRRQYFSHDAPGGRDLSGRVSQTGYMHRVRGWALGENIAWGTGRLGTPHNIMRGWMDSPGHRRNLLTPSYTDVGIGIVDDIPLARPWNGATYTTDFGDRR